MTLATRTPLKALSGKSKKCAVRACRKPFVPAQPFQSWCSPECGVQIARDKQQKERKTIEQRERRELKERKEKLKRPADHLKDAEKAVRDYRRLYELSIGSCCMSCGRSQEEVQAAQGWKTGGAWDAGHFLSKGARPELRLEPDNIWLQCKSCNGGSGNFARKEATVSARFELNLIQRIGLARVEELKADHRPRRYSIEDLQAIKAKYRALVRDLKKGAS